MTPLISFGRTRDSLRPYYTDGFKRLIEEGACFDAVHDHAWSATAPGHATL